MNGRCDLFELIREMVDDPDPVIAEIQARLGGARISIPANNGNLEDRKRALKLLRSGLSIEQVAQRLGYHRTTIWRWWNARRTISNSGFGSDEWNL